MAPLDFPAYLGPLVAGQNLNAVQAETLFGAVLDGELDTAQVGGLLMALAAKGEAVDEIVGAVRAMRARMKTLKAPAGAIDVCGTGGDKSGTLNISTAVTFVVAGAGVPVAKHGNRAQTSKSGAADTLEALGVKLDADFSILEEAMREAGTAFLLAPRHHPALGPIVPVRRALGVRSIFNLMGPLANPAGVKRQLVGVFSPALVTPLAEALRALGSEAAWVVHGDGLDELSISGESQVAVLHQDKVETRILHPEQAGLPTHPLSAIAGGEPAYNQAALSELLDGKPGPYRDAVLLNAAAALLIAERVSDLKTGVEVASDSLDSGSAKTVLQKLVSLTQG